MSGLAQEACRDLAKAPLQHVELLCTKDATVSEAICLVVQDSTPRGVIEVGLPLHEPPFLRAWQCHTHGC